MGLKGPNFSDYRDPIFSDSRDPNRIPETPLKNPVIYLLKKWATGACEINFCLLPMTDNCQFSSLIPCLSKKVTTCVKCSPQRCLTLNVVVWALAVGLLARWAFFLRKTCFLQVFVYVSRFFTQIQQKRWRANIPCCRLRGRTEKYRFVSDHSKTGRTMSRSWREEASH